MYNLDNKKIIFKVSNKVKNFLLISIICILILPFSGNIQEGDELGFIILCWGMATLVFILFLLFCEQVILQDEIFYVKNIFGRVHKCAFKDIVRADFRLTSFNSLEKTKEAMERFYELFK
jgi:hypothetical protein